MMFRKEELNPPAIIRAVDPIQFERRAIQNINQHMDSYRKHTKDSLESLRLIGYIISEVAKSKKGVWQPWFEDQVAKGGIRHLSLTQAKRAKTLYEFWDQLTNEGWDFGRGLSATLIRIKELTKVEESSGPMDELLGTVCPGENTKTESPQGLICQSKRELVQKSPSSQQNSQPETPKESLPEPPKMAGFPYQVCALSGEQQPTNSNPNGVETNRGSAESEMSGPGHSPPKRPINPAKVRKDLDKKIRSRIEDLFKLIQTHNRPAEMLKEVLRKIEEASRTSSL